jgi:hypothetical protein
MSKKTTNDQEQDKMIEKALRISGFLFPKTIDEIKEYEKIYGTTSVILPPDLESPDFIYNKKTSVAKIMKLHEENNFAMAARDGKAGMPAEIKNKILSDIDSLRKKDKKNKK